MLRLFSKTIGLDGLVVKENMVGAVVVPWIAFNDKILQRIAFILKPYRIHLTAVLLIFYDTSSFD